jgi:curved DNA-binding protein CbpA
MKTLYDLLGALPEDDADRLRAAFRKAAKANHPDNNPDDPDAPQRFRQIVRAHGILGDKRQRATYDWLLAVANNEPALPSRRHAFSSEVRNVLPNVIAGAVISLVSIAAFLLFEHVSAIAVVPAQVQEMSTRAPALAAAVPTQPPETIGQAASRNERDDVAPSSKPEALDTPTEPPAPVVAATDSTGAIPAIPNVAVKDAGYYRQQGGLAYRSGDLSLALVDFDLAIKLDPNSSDAYIDRAIVFRQMGDLKRALADVAQAKRIDDASRGQTAAIKPQPTPPSP